MFLVNELVLDHKLSKQTTNSEQKERGTYSRFWK